MPAAPAAKAPESAFEQYMQAYEEVLTAYIKTVPKPLDAFVGHVTGAVHCIQNRIKQIGFAKINTSAGVGDWTFLNEIISIKHAMGRDSKTCKKSDRLAILYKLNVVQDLIPYLKSNGAKIA